MSLAGAEGADRESTPADPGRLAECITALALPRDATILEIGSGGLGGQKLLAPLIDSFTGTIHAIDTAEERAGAFAARTPARIKRRIGDPFSVELPSGIALCTVIPIVARVADAYEELLYEAIYPAMADGGVVAIQLYRDVSDEALTRIKILSEAARTTLQEFTQAQFGTRQINDLALLEARFRNCPCFEFLGWARRSNRTIMEDPIVWLLLRKKPAPEPRPAAHTFPRTQRHDQFLQSELGTFLKTLGTGGFEFLPIDKFCERYAAHYADAPRKGAVPLAKPFAHVKLDIHNNMRRVLEVARLMSSIGVPGLFLMMPRHALNDDFYDSDATWSVLREIAAMGHEVGAHLDLFDLIRRHGDLYKGVESALADMRARGLDIRAATIHGETADHIRERKFQPNDFFADEFLEQEWDGVPPAGEEFFAEHAHRYTYEKLAQATGLRFFPEARLIRDGKFIAKRTLMYVSDNHRTIRIRPHEPGAIATFKAPTLFRIDEEFTRQAMEILRIKPFLALFHPQWYW